MKKFFKGALLLCMLVLTMSVMAACSTQLKGIRVDEDTVTNEIYLNETYDITDIIFYADYSDNTSVLVDHEDLEFSKPDTSTVGEKTITVTYQGKTCEIKFTVIINPNDIAITGISVNLESLKTELVVGQTLDLTNAQVYVNYNDSTRDTLDNSDVTFSTVDTTTAGEKTLTATYDTFTCEVKINVYEATALIVDETTVQKTFVIGDVYNAKTAKVYAKVSDTKKFELAPAEYTVSQLNLQQEGAQTLTYSYAGFNVPVSVYVFHSVYETYEIAGYQAPEFVGTFNSQRAEQTDKETEFFDRTKTYKVGYDNPFVFMPKVTVFPSAESDDTVTAPTLRQIVKVYLKVGTSYTELTDELATYVTIDTHTGSFQFTSAAKDQMFKIEMEPYYEEDWDVVSFEFEVVEGYNAYTTKDLSVIDNAQEELWNPWRATNNVQAVDTKAVVLHSNMLLQASDLPKGMFYQSEDADAQALLATYPGIVGTLRDFKQLYRNLMEDGETFTIEANYFTIDTTAIPYIQKYDAGEGAQNQISHSDLFGAVGPEEEPTTRAIFNLNNMNYVGNALRSENTAGAGGLIFLKASRYITVNASNCITLATLIAWFADNESVFNIDQVKSYDVYSTLVYAYGKAEMNITRSEMKRCGGPVLISNHTHSDENQNKFFTLNIDSASVMENYVTGQEAWFDSMGVGAEAASLISLDEIVRGFSLNTRTFTAMINDVRQMNCLYAIYDDNNILGTQIPTKTYVKMGDDVLDMTGNDQMLELYRAAVGDKAAAILQIAGNCMFIGAEADGITPALFYLDMSGGMPVPVKAGIPELTAFFSAGTKLNIILKGTLGIMVDLMVNQNV